MILLTTRKSLDCSLLPTSDKMAKVRLMRRYTLIAQDLFLDRLAQMNISLFQLAEEAHKNPEELLRDIRNEAAESFCRLHPHFLTDAGQKIPNII